MTRIADLVKSEPQQRDVEQEESDRLNRERHSSANGYVAVRGKRYGSCRLSNFEFHGTDEQRRLQREAVVRLRQWDIAAAFGEGQNLLLYGPVGSGKDHMLSACVYRLIFSAAVKCERFGEASSRAVQPKWTSGADLFGEMRDGITKKIPEASSLASYVGADLLCISDPVPSGQDTLTDFQAQALYRILDRRYNACRPTWITANILDRHEFDRRLSPQISDRLRDGALAVRCDWPSYRRTST